MNIKKVIFFIFMGRCIIQASQHQPPRDPNVDNMIYDFHRLIWQGNQSAVFDILEKPQQFSARYHLNYTAEQLCQTPDRWGRTCLHQAALTLENTAIITEAFIVCGADVNTADQNGDRPLHFLSNPATIQVLLAHGANIFAKNKRNLTTLDNNETVYEENPTKQEDILALRFNHHNKVEYCFVQGYDCDPSFFKRAQRSKKLIEKYKVC